jgi:tripartite-type tricarboxylate transporter receptor subunit TctC
MAALALLKPMEAIITSFAWYRTLNELGYSGMEDYTWLGIFVPASTPPEIAQKLNDAVLRAVKSPDIKERLDTLAFEPTAASLNLRTAPAGPTPRRSYSARRSLGTVC